MSGLYFTAAIEVTESLLAKEYICLLLKVKHEADYELLEQKLSNFYSKYLLSPVLEASELVQLQIESKSEGVFEILSEYPDLSIDFFVNFVALLNQFDGISYKARLFDSSSGGIAIWQVPEEDELDFEMLLVCMLGVDEEEGLHETLEDAGAVLKSEFHSEAKLIIYSDEIDIEALSSTVNLGAKLVHQDDFWDEFEYLSY
jgi:hypothetical protein